MQEQYAKNLKKCADGRKIRAKIYTYAKKSKDFLRTRARRESFSTKKQLPRSAFWAIIIESMETMIMSGDEAIALGAKIVGEGGIVAFPTETVYGLGADAFNAAAVQKIYRAKGRPSDNPLIVHISRESQLDGLVAEVTPAAKAAMAAFMPGPITLILPKSSAVPDIVSAGLSTVGVRMPSHPIARKFIDACKTPIAAPSANASKHVSPTSAAHVFADLQGRIPLIIDGGECEVGIESTILDLSVPVPTILRPGAITAEMIAEVLGGVQTFEGKVMFAKAPGMKYTDYAPKCGAIVAADADAAREEYLKRAADGASWVVLARDKDCAALDGVRTLPLGGDDAQVCRNVYAALRYAETRFDGILFVDLGDKGVCGSVMNRVNKSAGGRKVFSSKK